MRPWNRDPSLFEVRGLCVAACVVCTHCGDAGGVTPESESSSEGTGTSAGETSVDEPTTIEPTGADSSTGGESSSSGGGDESTTGESTGGVTPTDCALAGLPGPIAGGSWDPRFTVAGVAGPDGDGPHVADFARDKDGSVLAAGRFRWLGSTRIKPLLRAPAGGGAWASALDEWALEPEVFGGFSALAVGPDGALALATTGVAPAIWVDSGAGLEVVAQLVGTSDNGFVRALAWYDGALWVAGNHTLAGSGIPYLAVWDGEGWSSPPGGEADAPVSELTVANGRLYVGGAFDAVGGVEARRVAAWDGAAWEAFDMDWAHAGAVTSLALDADDQLIAGGRFSDQPADECPTRGSVARWTGAEWELLGLGVSGPDAACGSYAGLVYDIALHQGELFITGSFSHANAASDQPAATPAVNFARWVDGAWQSLDDGAPVRATLPWVPMGNEGVGVAGQRLLSDGERLLAGLLGPGVAEVASPGLIAYQGGQWLAQGPAPGLAVYTSHARFAVGGPGCALHAMGRMSHLGGEVAAADVLRYEDGGWTPVGARVPEAWSCQGGVAVDPAGTVFAGCDRLADGGSEVLALAGEAWGSIGAPAATGRVRSLVVDRRGVLWAVGGAVGEVGEAPSGFVARHEEGAWTTVTADLDGPVTHIDFAPDDDGSGEPRYVIGGGFRHVDGAAFNRVALREGGAWIALGDGLASPVSALEYGRHAIYASDTQGGAPAARIVGRWDGAAWAELATAGHGFPALVIAGVVQLIEAGDSLVVVGSLYGGEFPPQARNVLVFEGEQFEWLAGGVAATFMTDAAISSEGLWFSGGIAEAGVDPARVSSVGVAHYRWGR